MKTDEEYLRAGVEQADGWSCTEYAGTKQAYLDSAGGSLWRAHDDEEWPLSDLPQIMLDALAAQLVRQVDKVLDDWRLLELFPGHTAVRVVEKELGENNYRGRDLGACYGDDRAMNTVKAIVDSKVLE